MTPDKGINVSSLLSGIAIGSVLTFLGAIAVIPDGGQGGGPVVLADPSGNVQTVQPDGSTEGSSFDSGTSNQGSGTTGFSEVGGASNPATGTTSGSPGGGTASGPTPGATAPVAGDASSSDDVGGPNPEATSGNEQPEGGQPAGEQPTGESSDDTSSGPTGQSGGSVDVGGGSGGGSAEGSQGGSGGGEGAPPDDSGFQCAPGQNGGETDTGITGTEIKLGATIVRGGIGEAFLGEVPLALEAVRKQVNREGGICGRQLRLIMQDDEWDAETGARFIRNLVEGEGVFALAVSPSSEGLNLASRQGYFRQTGVPVVGADGLNATQFTDPFIWPVAAATTTTVHVLLEEAFRRAAPTTKELRPVIVFGNTYRFGVEGAFAFNAAFKDRTGNDIPGYKNPLASGGGGCERGTRFCGISAGAGQYQSQVDIVNEACNTEPKCNFLLLLLEPQTAQQWMKATGAPEASKAPYDVYEDPNKTNAGFGIAGAQPLFTFDFGRNCGDKCNGMWVWTGYNPPIEQYAPQRNAAVRAYVETLHTESSSADEFNQFTEGGYLGMRLFVRALETVGPNLTRERLIATLNSMPPFESGLTVPLQWTETSRYANHSAQAFQMLSQGGFSGWQFVQDRIRDPWLGQHAGG